MPKINKAVGFCIIVYIIVSIYFLFSPLFVKSIDVVLKHNLHSLSDARNYYTVLSSVSSIVTGFLGLILGYMYFKMRNEFESNSSLSNRMRGRTQLIIEQLNKYDEQVDEILSGRCTLDEELKRYRGKIERLFEIVEILIDNNEKLLKFTEDDIKTVMYVNSFVEQTPEIMEFNIIELGKSNLSDLRQTYIEKIQDARRMLFLKTE
jgi:hypothetical protein